MAQSLTQVYQDTYAAELAAGATPREAHVAAQDQVREASR